VAGPESVGVVSLTNKGAMGLDEFLYRRPETACEGGKNGFVDEPLLAGVVGIVVDSDEVIEGFDEFGFGLGGVEVRKRRLLPGLLLLLLLSGAVSGRSLCGLRFCDRNERSLHFRMPGSAFKAAEVPLAPCATHEIIGRIRIALDCLVRTEFWRVDY
jgi:hypothetical protein